MKKKIIEAVETLIEKYSTNTHKQLINRCSLCVLYHVECSICLNNAFGGVLGCTNRAAFFTKVNSEDICILEQNQDLHAKYWSNVLPYIKKVPEQYLYPPSEGVKKKLREIAEESYK